MFKLVAQSELEVMAWSCRFVFVLILCFVLLFVKFIIHNTDKKSSSFSLSRGYNRKLDI